MAFEVHLSDGNVTDKNEELSSHITEINENEFSGV